MGGLRLGAAILVSFGPMAEAAGTQDTRLAHARRTLAQSAQADGLSSGEARQAVAALHHLVDAGLPVSHALEIVRASLTHTQPPRDVDAVVRAVALAHRSGASSYELVNLTRDLTRTSLDGARLLQAIEAVGRLAEEGYTDAETRHGVALVALHDGERGLDRPDLAERLRDETRRNRDDAEREPAGRGRHEPARSRPEDRKERDSDGHGRPDVPRQGPREDKEKDKDKGPSENPGRGRQ
jgi:hypothetical protein